MQFKSEPIELANESISMLDLMRDTKIFPCGYIHLRQLTTGMVQQSIVFLKSPWSIQVQRGTRSIQKFQLPNNGEWEYITIPTSAFKSGSVTMDQGIQSDIYTALNQMTIIFPYKDYFGANPTSDTLETPWEEPLKIDEILLTVLQMK